MAIPGVNLDNAVDKQEVYQYLVDEKGISHEHAVGILANIADESSFDPGAIQDGVDNPGIGLFQYTYPSRKRRFEAGVPDWETNWKAQVDYVIEKDPLTKPYLNRTFESSADAAEYFARYWERPADIDKNVNDRRAFANAHNESILIADPIRYQGQEETLPQGVLPFGDWLKDQGLGEFTGDVPTDLVTKHYEDWNKYKTGVERANNPLNKFQDLTIKPKTYEETVTPSILFGAPQSIPEDGAAPKAPEPKSKRRDDFITLLEANKKTDNILTGVTAATNIGILGYNASQKNTKLTPHVSIPDETVKLQSPDLTTEAKQTVDRGFNTGRSILRETGFGANDITGLISARNKNMIDIEVKQANLDAEIDTKEAQINTELSRQKNLVETQINTGIDLENKRLRTSENLMKGQAVSASIQGLLNTFVGNLSRSAKRSESLLMYDAYNRSRYPF